VTIKPRLLDLFCGAGGAAVGYHRAGFEVIGVDIKPQPRYPFEFHQGDAMSWPFDGYDAIHASPPCQKYSSLANMRFAHTGEYVDLYEPTRWRLNGLDVPWVLENVIGAPYRSGFVLCGSMFGLKVRRHRNFESSHALLLDRYCDHVGQGRPYGVYGHGGGGQMTRGHKGKPSEFAWLMDMDWATPQEIAQAIPPAYTEWIGAQLLAAVEAAV
jgi:DNA (cytosine-5)-methyltransferase 1